VLVNLGNTAVNTNHIIHIKKEKTYYNYQTSVLYCLEIVTSNNNKINIEYASEDIRDEFYNQLLEISCLEFNKEK